MRGRERYERELAATVGSPTDRWLTELRLAVLGITVSVALGAADIALSLATWEVAAVAGVGSTLAFVGLLWRARPRAAVRPQPGDEDLRRVGDELARIRTALAENPDPLRELLDRLAAETDALAESIERVWEESYLETASGRTLRRLRDYDRELHELTAEIRCRRAKT